MSLDLEKARRELARWLILQALNSASYIGASDAMLLTALQAVIPDMTLHELRGEMDYLSERALLSLAEKQSPAWRAKLTRTGTDFVEYTIDAEPGIARPPNYW